MKKIKGLASKLKVVKPLAKKVPSAALGVIRYLGILEDTSQLVKPIVSDVMGRNIEKFKRIDADQFRRNGRVIIMIEKADIVASAKTEAVAFELFVRQLLHLRRKKIVSNDKKVRRAQLALIEKIRRIEADGGNLAEYVYRIQSDEAR